MTSARRTARSPQTCRRLPDHRRDLRGHLPALFTAQGRAAGHVGPNLYTTQGMKLGSETVTVQLPQYPAHNHAFNANGAAGTAPLPNSANFLASTATTNLYVAAQGAAVQPLWNGSPVPVIGIAAGGSMPHENMQPFLALNYCISLSGVFPARG